VTERVLLCADGRRVALPSRAFELLVYFLRHPGELLDKDRLMAAVWPDTVVEENNLSQCIGVLRKALGETPGERRFLVTEPGRGYRFVAAVTAPETRPLAPPPPDVASAHPAKPRGRKLVMTVLAMCVLLGAALTWRWHAPPPVVDRSIAVLPFENRSDARENAYLALGIQDEILTLLTRVGELRVVARNSTLRYAGTSADATQIGRELGVAYLLSGSVQRAGDTVRINVALVDAAGDRHLWAQSYERSAADVFAIESEVAQSVATALQARLTAEEHAHITRPPTASPAAYEAYLRARAAAERTTRTEAEIHAAIDAYQDAVRLDPEFASAWAQLSRRHANLFSLAYDRSDARRDAARRALGEAQRLGPGLVETETARGYYLFVVEGDLSGAERLFRALEVRAPQSADASAGLAQITRELGQMDRSADYARRTLALDAMNPYRHSVVCQDYATARELDLALQTCERALTLLPGDIGIRALLATIHQARGELDRSRELLRDLSPGPGDWRSLRAMSRQLLLERKPAAAAALLANYLEQPASLGTRRGIVRRWLADAQRLSGDVNAARATYGESLLEIENELERQPANPVLMAEHAIVRGRLGQFEAGIRLVPRCLDLAQQPRRDAFIAECALAQIQVELAGGDPSGAVASLKGALTLRGALPPVTKSQLQLDPEYDELRPRKDFQALL
jgi:TolB-like protein/DNA-binding winged helix-turn-helix (wHTH) protein